MWGKRLLAAARDAHEDERGSAVLVGWLLLVPFGLFAVGLTYFIWGFQSAQAVTADAVLTVARQAAAQTVTELNGRGNYIVDVDCAKARAVAQEAWVSVAPTLRDPHTFMPVLAEVGQVQVVCNPRVDGKSIKGVQVTVSGTYEPYFLGRLVGPVAPKGITRTAVAAVEAPER